MSKIDRLLALFTGLPRAYGTYVVDENVNQGKAKKTGKARTIAKPYGAAEWEAHLKGDVGLGIVPIRDDGTVLWAAIDIDAYDVDVPKKLNEFARQYQLPAVVCRTKSGGGHFYFFFKEPIQATVVRPRLKEISEALGFAGAEIFPKQDALNVEEGDVGNWLNMPYFDGDRETLRYGFNARGVPLLDVEQFLDYAESCKISEAAFKALEIPETDHAFADGPPCLQRLALSRVQEGGRNIALFQFAVYAKEKYPDQWQNKVQEYNQKYFVIPVDFDEVARICRQHEKKEYGYKCQEEPMVSVCARQVCIHRRYGIAQGNAKDTDAKVLVVEGMLSNLKKLVHYGIDGKQTDDPPKWVIAVEEVPIRLTTEELLNQRRFSSKCVERINRVIDPIPVPAWTRIIQGLLDGVEVVEIPFETSPLGMLLNLLMEYLQERGGARSRIDLFQGLALKENDAYIFKVDGFAAYMQERLRTQVNMPDIWARLQACGVTRHETTVMDGEVVKKLNYWRVPLTLVTPPPDRSSQAVGDPEF